MTEFKSAFKTTLPHELLTNMRPRRFPIGPRYLGRETLRGDWPEISQQYFGKKSTRRGLFTD